MRISWPCCSAGLIRTKRIVGQRTVMRVSRAKIDERCCKEAEGDYQKRCNTVFVNFDAESFAESIETVVKKLQPPEDMKAANR